MKLLPTTHHQARKAIWIGIVVAFVAGGANFLLGGTGGLLWIALTAVGFILALAGIAWLVAHPIRRSS